jgi:hypothetical protein
LNIKELGTWLQARLPAHLLAAPPEVAVYDDEVVITLHLATGDQPTGELDEERRLAEQRLIDEQREVTRSLRMRLAREIQDTVGRSVAWGMRAGETTALFSTRSVPVMTRLGRAERDVLDTLVSAGVADTRSAALAYVVRAFAAEHGPWLDEVRTAIAQVVQVRDRLKLSRRQGAPPIDAPDE